MEYVIDAVHSVAHGLNIAYVTDVKFDFVCHIRHFYLKFVAHIVLLFLVTRKNSDLPDVGGEETVQNGVAKRARASCDQKSFICEQRHIDHSFSCRFLNKFLTLLKYGMYNPHHLIFVFQLFSFNKRRIVFLSRY